jgi:hypothetical protein
MPGSKGSLLIEVLASVLILSVGILTVMQGFATQSRAAMINQRKTRELLVMADHLGVVLSGIPQERSGKADDQERDTVKISERKLDEENAGLREMTLIFEETGLAKKNGMMILTYVKDAAPL